MQAVIADFGLASSYCPCRGGTIGYYAPEIFSSGSNTMKSDIWSLGISLVDACFPNNEYPERDQANRGIVPHKIRNILDSKRFQILENMISGDPWARHDLRIETLPQPHSTRVVTSSVKISTLDTKISQHAEDIANRYLEKTGEQPNNNISQAAVAIAQKWLNKKVTGVNDIAQQWKIIMVLNGLIYLKPI
jgi:serine/threonine protein kinase